MKDPNLALRVVCQQLTFLADWTPKLIDKTGEPTSTALNTKTLATCKRIAKKDADNPPPMGPRLNRFVRRVDEQIAWEFFLGPGDLIDGSLTTIEEIVDRIMTS